MIISKYKKKFKCLLHLVTKISSTKIILLIFFYQGEDALESLMITVGNSLNNTWISGNCDQQPVNLSAVITNP